MSALIDFIKEGKKEGGMSKDFKDSYKSYICIKMFDLVDD